MTLLSAITGVDIDSPLIEIRHTSLPSALLRQINSPSEPYTTILFSLFAGPAVRFISNFVLQNAFPEDASKAVTCPSRLAV